ncbi:hypothetical protein [Heyndrickxia sporothermodurans]|uniref:hypothetical protein n=3 Tax=Heyndrickxia sporothermodurans TaxID=46224 RepID=UPI0035D895F6
MKVKKGISFLRIFWVTFLILIALFLVYLYQLYTEGLLAKKILFTVNQLTEMTKKNPILCAGLVSYIIIFFLGYSIGKKRR